MADPDRYQERFDRLRVLAMLQGVGKVLYSSHTKYPWTFYGGLEENSHRTQVFSTFEKLEAYVLGMDIGDPI